MLDLAEKGYKIKLIKVESHRPEPNVMHAGNHAADQLAGIAATGVHASPVVKPIPLLEEGVPSYSLCGQCMLEW